MCGAACWQASALLCCQDYWGAWLHGRSDSSYPGCWVMVHAVGGKQVPANHDIFPDAHKFQNLSNRWPGVLSAHAVGRSLLLPYPVGCSSFQSSQARCRSRSASSSSLPSWTWKHHPSSQCSSRVTALLSTADNFMSRLLQKSSKESTGACWQASACSCLTRWRAEIVQDLSLVFAEA